MQIPVPPPPRPSLPRRLLDDAWWLADALIGPSARVIPFPSPPRRPTPEERPR